MAEGGDIEEIEREPKEPKEQIVKRSILMNPRREGGANIVIENAGLVTSGDIHIVNHIGQDGKKQKTKKAKKPLTNSTELPSVEELQYISCRLGARWKKLGRKLEWDEGFLEHLEHDHPTNTEERNYQMLCKWKQAKGEGATKKVLAKQLADCGSGDLADYLHGQ
ncbi:receptor-interacting serine/threonine-protein kinase 1 [Plakobranchus ocellatus]|uniref:Receptor-interacting serine/threonine-protein kinase 1 n=1 Tax=Plakobranchus ocellatus TaxID=259542 RepID=A0AAV4A3J3_9GAST|nr:receptor-interacting serine/threonine-protein kinase 1 [Plakobranchus ocellatus]